MEHVGEGRSASDARVDLESLASSDFANCRFVRPALPELQSRGANVRLLQDYPGIVQFSGPAVVPVVVRSVRESAGAVQLDKDHQGTVFFDLSRLGPTLVSQLEIAVLFVPDLQHVSIALVADVPAGMPVPPFAHWLGTDRDAWLLDAVQDRAGSGRDWDVASAVGMWARLFETHSTERARELAAMLLRGESASVVAAPRAWAQGLSEDACARIEAACRHELHRLHDMLTGAAGTPRVTVDEDALAVCHLRDDIESVRHVLRVAQRRDSLSDDIAAVDSDGDNWRATHEFDFEDERLRRVSLSDPQAWWAAND
jgi:hypothetical protein